MDRRRFLLTSMAGALAVPFAAEATAGGEGADHDGAAEAALRKLESG
jgi:hypothetical protein